jgi:hypothetical protein
MKKRTRWQGIQKKLRAYTMDTWLLNSTKNFFDWRAAPCARNLSGLKRAAAILQDHLKENRRQNSYSLCPRLCIEVNTSMAVGRKNSPAKGKGKAQPQKEADVNAAKEGKAAAATRLRNAMEEQQSLSQLADDDDIGIFTTASDKSSQALAQAARSSSLSPPPNVSAKKSGSLLSVSQNRSTEKQKRKTENEIEVCQSIIQICELENCPASEKSSQILAILNAVELSDEMYERMGTYSYDGSTFTEEPDFELIKDTLHSHILLSQATIQKEDRVTQATQNRVAQATSSATAGSRRDSGTPFRMAPPSVSIPSQPPNTEKRVSS